MIADFTNGGRVLKEASSASQTKPAGWRSSRCAAQQGPYRRCFFPPPPLFRPSESFDEPFNLRLEPLPSPTSLPTPKIDPAAPPAWRPDARTTSPAGRLPCWHISHVARARSVFSNVHTSQFHDTAPVEAEEDEGEVEAEDEDEGACSSVARASSSVVSPLAPSPGPLSPPPLLGGPSASSLERLASTKLSAAGLLPAPWGMRSEPSALVSSALD